MSIIDRGGRIIGYTYKTPADWRAEQKSKGKDEKDLEEEDRVSMENPEEDYYTKISRRSKAIKKDVKYSSDLDERKRWCIEQSYKKKVAKQKGGY